MRPWNLHLPHTVRLLASQNNSCNILVWSLVEEFHYFSCCNESLSSCWLIFFWTGLQWSAQALHLRLLTWMCCFRICFRQLGLYYCRLLTFLELSSFFLYLCSTYISHIKTNHLPITFFSLTKLSTTDLKDWQAYVLPLSQLPSSCAIYYYHTHIRSSFDVKSISHVWLSKLSKTFKSNFTASISSLLSCDLWKHIKVTKYIWKRYYIRKQSVI